MAYVGRIPSRGQNREIDDISSSFNGSTTAFTLQSGGANASPGSANQLFVNLGGVMQNPGTDFTVSNYTITFTTAPAAGLSFWALIQGDAVDINTPADDSVTGAKLSVSLATGDVLYASGTDTLAKLGRGTDGQYLKLASGVPSWAAAGGNTIIDGTNTHSGTDAGAALTSATGNTAYGHSALKTSNANNQTSFGYQALKLATGGGNTAIGKDAGLNCSTGFVAFAGGEQACKGNTTGSANVGVGAEALKDNEECNNCTAVGYRALENVGTGSTSAHDNTAIGRYAGRDLLTGWNSTCIGADAQASSTSASNQITLGNSSVSGLRCNETSISALSDQRDKTDIVNLPIGLNFVKSLRPVKFKWARRDPNDNDNDGKIRAGFLAQELQTAMGSDTYLDLIMDDNPDKLEAKIGNLIPVLVQAIKELEAKVAALESA
jgi:hypothetical protein